MAKTSIISYVETIEPSANSREMTQQFKRRNAMNDQPMPSYDESIDSETSDALERRIVALKQKMVSLMN